METRKMSSRAIILALTIQLVLYLSASAQSGPHVLTNPSVNEPVAADVSTSLREMPRITANNLVSVGVHPVLHPKKDRLAQQALESGLNLPSTSAAAQFLAGNLVPATIALNFDGLDQGESGGAPPDALSCNFFVTQSLVVPPDTNAAIGDTQIVEWVNLCYAVFDKATGALLAGPFPGNQFWQGFGRGCQTANSGDPVIQWDKLAHRWVAFQNIFSYPYEACIAISTTADATGSYYRYVFNLLQGFPDYPKIGIMPDAYYQTQNNFGPGATAFAGVTACAYQRSLMLQGSAKAQQVCFVDDSNGTLFDDSFLPADLDSPEHLPPPGQPEVLLGSIDNALAGTAVYEYLFHVDWKHPSRSTFTGADGSLPISVPGYNLPVCTAPDGSSTLACVSQPPVYDSTDLTTNLAVPLDTLGDRLMYRLAYYNDGTTQRWVTTHTVTNSSATAVRWYQFAAPEGSTLLSLAQAGETPDDGEFRWMASAAMDKSGNIAIGYSRSSAATGDFPSIYYAGHTAGEPANTTDAENLIFQGSGTAWQVDRWGDYTSMALDAADGCTFIYANEYLPPNNVDQGIDSGNDGGWDWRTRVASLTFPGCH
jgi:hypothetical protein